MARTATTAKYTQRMFASLGLMGARARINALDQYSADLLPISSAKNVPSVLARAGNSPHNGLPHSGRRTMIRRTWAAAVLAATVLLQPGNAPAVEEFFRGKQIKMVLPTAPGGST